MKSTSYVGYMAIDQYGQTYHLGDCSPHKALLEKFCRRHASKMYRDSKSGEARHVGWIIAGHWLEVFRVHTLA